MRVFPITDNIRVAVQGSIRLTDTLHAHTLDSVSKVIAILRAALPTFIESRLNLLPGNGSGLLAGLKRILSLMNWPRAKLLSWPRDYLAL